MCLYEQERITSYNQKEGNLKMDKKEIFLNGEGDAWYRRNKKAIQESGEISQGYNFIKEFMKEQNMIGEQYKVLEVGCSYGYNLSYLNHHLNVSCYGIEPSLEAVKEGTNKFSNNREIHLVQGTSDLLPYEENRFDIVILDFCLFWVDRKYLFRTMAEADRVLKCKGHLIIIDFDTNIPYKRENIHNAEAYTYKMQYSNLFLANPQYYLVDKKSFSHEGMTFHPNIQERISLNILYKDTIENTYQKG